MKRSLCLIVATLVLSGFGYAFDTGPHFDLTRSVLSERGFSDNAIKVVQVENWLTDYYSSSPTASDAEREDLEKLHFDNLFNTAEVTRYWGWLLNNIREATRQAAQDGDKLALLTTLGMALHATQDFYSHSNWVELHPRTAGGPYRIETWISVGLKGLPSGTQLRTGKYPENRKGAPAGAVAHGNYKAGLNKDSQVRPHWDEAYVFAYCASHELLTLMQGWAEEARPGFWQETQQFKAEPADQAKLAYDLRAVRNMSMWIGVKDEDGHWKGNHSGVNRFFDTFSSKWIGKSNSSFVAQMKERKLHKRLVNNLYSDSLPSSLMTVTAPFQPVRFSLTRRAVLVRTTLIKKKGDEDRLELGIDPGGKPDFYSLLKIGNQYYVERVLQDQDEFSEPWFELHLVDPDVVSVPITISVWDEDDLDADGNYKDNHIDINPLAELRDLYLVFNIASGSMSGDVSGIHNSAATAFTAAGAKPDNKRAVIRVYVTSYPLNRNDVMQLPRLPTLAIGGN